MPNAYITNQKPIGFGPAMSMIVEMLVGAGWTYQGSGTGTAGIFSPAPTTVTISNGSPAVVTWTGSHGLLPGVPVVFTTTGDLPAGLTPGVTYYVVAAGFTTTAFQVASTVGGAPINTSTAGSGTHTATVVKVFTTATAPTAVKLATASPGLVYWPKHGLPVGSSVQFIASAGGGSLPSGISASTNYYVMSAGYSSDVFQISATVTGAAINITTGSVGICTGICTSGWGNALAWVRLQDPGGTREFVFQHNNSGLTNSAKIKYSASAKFIGTSSGAVSATVTPTAVDERVLRGTGAVGVGGTNTWFHPGTATGSVVWQGAAMASAPYGFWFCGQAVGSGTRYTGLLLDPVISVPEDPDPAVIYCAAGNYEPFCLNTSALGMDISQVGTWTRAAGGSNSGAFAFMDVGKTAFLSVLPMQYVCTGGNASAQSMASVSGAYTATSPFFVNTNNAYLGPNPYTNAPDAMPVPWMRTVVTNNLTLMAGLKGWSTMTRWTTMNRTTFVDTMDDKKWICVGPWWLPWDGVTTPRND